MRVSTKTFVTDNNFVLHKGDKALLWNILFMTDMGSDAFVSESI